jgi:uncharacterized lipoprotein
MTRTYKNNLFASFTLLAGIVLTGCQAPSQHVILQPNYTAVNPVVLNQSIAISVADQRQTQTTMTIRKSDSKESLQSLYLAENITPMLEKAFKQVGANVTNASDTQIQLNIKTLHTNVEQSIHKYSATGNVVFELVATKGLDSFSKTFRGNNSQEGPFGYDKATIEAQLNRLLEDVISRIVSDPQVIGFIKG